MDGWQLWVRWLLPSIDFPPRPAVIAAPADTVLRPIRCVLGVLALVLTATACRAQGQRATVLSVGDGDTLRVRLAAEQRTVRLACIDAPELSQRPDGQEARERLRQLAPVGAVVRLEVKATDRYGRLVAEVFTTDNLNLGLLEAGAAFVYPHYLKQCDGAAYRAAEQRAMRRRLGVWRVEGGITRPWLARTVSRGSGWAQKTAR